MIVPMMKYSLVVYHKEYRTFLENLQELGLVDVTTSVWEPTPEERAMVNKIDTYRKGITSLRKIKGGAKKKNLGSLQEAFKAYTEATENKALLQAELSKTEKEIEELRPWGDFPVEEIQKLKDAGVTMYFYLLFNKEFESFQKKWADQYIVREVRRDSISTYFVVVVPNYQKTKIDAQPLKTPAFNVTDKIREKEAIESELKAAEEIILRAAPYADDFEKRTEALSNQLHLSKVAQSGEREADGTLVVLEGWATEETQAKVDEMLDNSGVFYLKEKPDEGDNTPVKLKNSKFFGTFEMIGNFYALPKYGTTDITPYWGPFYALFFGFCLGDAGYGLLYVLAGLYMILKIKGKWEGIGRLVISCGIGAILFGILTGNFFGIELANMKVFAGMKDLFLNTDNLFTLALALGLVHILFGMSLKIMGIIQRDGIKYALAAIGWMLVITSSLGALLLPMIGLKAFSMTSAGYLILLGIGVVLMMFFNSPGKNPLDNFGAGLWNTYNDITGLLSDVLSYIRLFALSLSTAVLALVFNDLAMGMSPDIPVVKQIVMLLILVIGHSINLFMGSLSSFVHPMRLTFVEFYKNAGFQPSPRAFNPLKK